MVKKQLIAQTYECCLDRNGYYSCSMIYYRVIDRI